MHKLEQERMAAEEREYAAYMQEHAQELEDEAYALWVEDQCEGHESLEGPIGNVEYCDGTCRPLSERGRDAWIEATCADDPRDV